MQFHIPIVVIFINKVFAERVIVPFDDTIFLRQNVDILSFFTDDQIRQVTAVIERNIYDVGKTIVFQGEIGQNFYIIKRGKVQVTARSGKDRAELAELKAGDFFGEISLLDEVPVSATVKVAEPDTEILTLSHDVFNKMLKENPPLELMIRQRINERRIHREQALKKEPPPAQ
jgi:CRP-like cAMP-binding protein